jgi:translation initiation factor IF-3
MKKKERTIMNDFIRYSEVRVLGPEGENFGVMKRDVALEKARDLGMDLILVAENSKPPTCRIADYGKFKYLESKKSKKDTGAVSTETKVLRIGVGTGEGDMTLKAKQASQWLKEGHRVKLDLKLERRENYLDLNFLKEKLNRAMILLTEDFKVAEDFKKIPNHVVVVIEKAKKSK